ncbi:hypothetical protein [Pectobacterium zantedeschiae]|uniref:hypothetical protein n=1 Tax=Pectobacterium zantedeschiae TaxID=2034769 RepID=UPI0013EBE2FD|nr:hypothetical protein [Pectobacterium zantedeschiae]
MSRSATFPTKRTFSFPNLPHHTPRFMNEIDNGILPAALNQQVISALRFTHDKSHDK